MSLFKYGWAPPKGKKNRKAWGDMTPTERVTSAEKQLRAEQKRRRRKERNRGV